TDPAPTARAGLDRRAHAERVAQILDWIAAGDLYQANLTFQIAVDWDGSAAALARQLSGATPGAAHAALLHPGSGQAVVSVSPETFLRTRGDRVESRPIKGTRRRSADPVTDRRNARALSASAKDAAEHVMIVDLVRNDLGRVCRPGSITVPTLAGLESHPTVWHLSSSIRGAMTPTTSLGDLLAATFPPGSVTGAPKRMAVSKTALLEPVRRGVYCGAVGVVARGGATLSVAIRTAVVEDGLASYGAGGGIVADSDASAEYDEALDKAAAFLRATGATLAG
ncbi:MAG TPA: anthranilate synthase component I family protein, partial [Egibacteraceae bacterium]|nr:anthranilate synthase component I family protein [Egibacteraceae bacterium]